MRKLGCESWALNTHSKQTIITKEHDPTVETTIFYNDLKAYGKGCWEFYRKAVDKGIEYIRGRPYEVIQDPETKNLILRYEDLETGKLKDKEVELLVLATGIVPNSRNKKLAKILKIDVSSVISKYVSLSRKAHLRSK